ncbi:MAG TPA: HAD family phosphatase [Chromatiaceae bacterium]|nr:HAD family phosphatase [Chromatiaceae bacterium]
MNDTGIDISTILFDFGGVLADEGFRDGLAEIARKNGLKPGSLLEPAMDAVYESRYLLGGGTEEQFWQLLRHRYGITADTSALRNEILQRFRLRPWMLDIVDDLKHQGYRVGILSDQTNWLDELEARDHFFDHFDVVFNSYYLGMGKRDPEVFDKVAEKLGVVPGEILFIDDSPGNVERAQSRGLRTLLFVNREQLEQELMQRLNAATS